MTGSLLMYLVLSITAALGSVAAWDDLRSGKRKRSHTRSASMDSST